jgi:nitrile hydratase
MNGVHDMGGLQGFGPVVPSLSGFPAAPDAHGGPGHDTGTSEAGEPLFHAAWERRALGLTLAMGATGQWNIDQMRSARESLPPAQYLGSSYYQIWTAALERMLLQRGLVGADELAAGHALQAPLPVARVLQADAVDAALARGTPSERPVPGPARFAVGDRVRALNLNPPGHTRLPRYVRGHVGTVAMVHGAHVFPDTHATPGAAEAPQWLYTVAFTAAELWGPQGGGADEVSVDAWDSYLEPA